jgi:RimJ/RimL family protein N-acetyltransferase
MRESLRGRGTSGMFAPIETERLCLRALEQRDAEAVRSYRILPEVAIKADIDGMNARAIGAPGQWYQVGICLRSTGELIGDCGLRVPECDRSQVEIALNPAMQRRGYGTEALRAFMDYLFRNKGSKTIFATVDAANTRSAALMLRLGMRKVERHGEQQNDELEEVFEIVKEKH